MATAKHWCQDCQTHFSADPKIHADTYHDGYYFRGVVNGNWRDFEEDDLIDA